MFVNDLRGSEALLAGLKHYMGQLVDFLGCGRDELLSDTVLEFYKRLISFRSDNLRLAFFDMVNLILLRVSGLCERLEKEKRAGLAEVEFCVNLEMFHDPRAVVKKLLFTAYAQVKKEEDRAAKRVDKDKKVSLEKNFLIEVIDQASSEFRKNSLVLENVCIVNAYYDILSNSFKPTPVKSVSRIGCVRLTPVTSPSSVDVVERRLKAIPFVDEASCEELCVFRTRFWQGGHVQSCNSTGSQKENLKRNSANSSDSKLSSQTGGAGGNVPILNPIYFCILNPCQSFTGEFCQFFKNNPTG